MPPASSPSSADPLSALYDAATHLRSLSPSNAPPAASALPSGRPSYELLISSVKGPDPVKSLCAEFLPDFIHWYPSLADTAFSAQLDLIEDEKTDIRKRAVRGLEKLCKNNLTYVAKSSDVLGQLLVAEDAAELTLVRKTFAALVDLDPIASFGAIFNLIRDGQTEAAVRATAIEFLKTQMERCRTNIRGTTEKEKKGKDKKEKEKEKAGAGQPPSSKPSEEKKDEVVASPISPLLSTILNGVESLLSLSDLPPKDFTLFLKYLLSFKAWRDVEANKNKLQSLLETVAGIHKAIPKDGGAASVGSADAQISSFLSVFRSLSGYKKYGVQAAPFLTFVTQTLWPRLTTNKERDNPYVDNVLTVKSKLALLRAVVLSPLLSGAEIDSKYVRSVVPSIWSSLSTWMAKSPEIPKSKHQVGDEKKKEGEAAAPSNKEYLYSVTAAESSCRDYFAIVEATLALVHVLFHVDPLAALSVCGIGNIAGQPLDAATEGRKGVTHKALTAISEAATAWAKETTEEIKEIGKEMKANSIPKAEVKDESEEKKTARKEKISKLQERKSYLLAAKKFSTSIGQLTTSMSNKTPSFKSKTEMTLSFSGKKEEKGEKSDNGKKGKQEKGKGKEKEKERDNKGKGSQSKGSNKKDGKGKEKESKEGKKNKGKKEQNAKNDNGSNKNSNSQKRRATDEPSNAKRRKTDQGQSGQHSRGQSMERKGGEGQSKKQRRDRSQSQSQSFSSNPLIQMAIQQQKATQQLQMQMLQNMVAQNPQYANLMGMMGAQQQQQQQQQQQGGGQRRGKQKGKGNGQNQQQRGRQQQQQSSRKRKN